MPPYTIHFVGAHLLYLPCPPNPLGGHGEVVLPEVTANQIKRHHIQGLEDLMISFVIIPSHH